MWVMTVSLSQPEYLMPRRIRIMPLEPIRRIMKPTGPGISTIPVTIQK